MNNAVNKIQYLIQYVFQPLTTVTKSINYEFEHISIRHASIIIIYTPLKLDRFVRIRFKNILSKKKKLNKFINRTSQ